MFLLQGPSGTLGWRAIAAAPDTYECSFKNTLLVGCPVLKGLVVLVVSLRRSSMGVWSLVSLSSVRTFNDGVIATLPVVKQYRGEN